MTPVYSVADLHGRLDLLEGAVRLLPDAHLVVLGDVIDRGPHSLGCVRRLMELQAEGRVTLLWGNHEQMAVSGARRYAAYEASRDLADYREAMTRFAWWMENGGSALRREVGPFGVENLPPELHAYLELLRYRVYVDRDGGLHDEPPAGPSVLVTHAAPPKAHRDYPDPTIASLWMRPFDGPFDLPPGVAWSVHGHTPLRAPARLGSQVYTDLGAVSTGRLCLVRLDADLRDDGSPEVVVLQGEGSTSRAQALPMVGRALTFRVAPTRG